MATRTGRLGSWEGITVSSVYNDANNSMASVTVTNVGPKTLELTLWRTDDENNPVVRTFPPGPSQTFNVMSNVRYSAVELPPGDPKASNFGYSVRTF